MATILVADDEPKLLKLLGIVLRMAGHLVLLAASGAEAIDLATRHAVPIDLLIVDARMPPLSGIKTAAIIKAAWPEMRVLFMSGHSEKALAALGPDRHFLAKPFIASEFLKKVEAVLR